MKPLEFLMLVLISTAIIHIRAIYEKAGEKKRAIPFECSFEDYPKLEPQLRALNEQGFGICFGVNGCVKDDEAKFANAQFVESDTLSLEEQAENLRRFPLKPSLVVQTRKSLHAYWLLYEGGDISLFRPIQTALWKHFSGDPTLVNESKYMRLPGFYHQKQDPVMVEVVEYNPDCRYTQQELIDCLESLGVKVELERSKHAREISKDRLYVPKGIAPGLQSEEHLQMMLENCEFFIYCKENCATLSEPLWRSALSNLIRFKGGEDAAHELSKGYPGYSFTETQGKIEEIKDYGFGPIRCDTLREYGFNCPKHCGCAAPAALPWLLDDENWDKGIEPWYTVSNTRWTVNTDEVLKVLRWAYPAYYVNGEFYIYRSGCYRPTKPDIVKWQYISGYLHEGLRHVRVIDEIYTKWVMSVTLENSDIFNSDPDVINLANGIFSLQDNTLHEHTPDLLSSIQLNAAYVPGSTCPRFLQFLSDVLENDLVPVIQEMFGYCLTVSTAAQKGFILFGKARAGKSTLLLVLLELLSASNACHLSLQELELRFRTSRLEGKLLNECADLPVTPLRESGTIKKVIAGEPIEAERKGKDLYTLRPYCKFVFSCNELPANYADRSDGLYRRLILIPFLKSVSEKDMNPNLLSELTAERDGILLWAIEGLQRLRANGYRFSDSPSAKRALEQYRFESSSTLRFVGECCTINPQFEESRNFLYKFYQAWCLQNGMKPLANPNFVKEMEREFPQLVFKKDSRTKRALWCGIKFNYLEQRPLIDQIRDKLTAEEIQALDDLLPF